ncbi:MAG: quinone-dependent dihydroorotate dehydrogenase [Flavobacteriaceae bacterium]|nr:quinone-dependent dihydroorotate dehydrogenase [Flavobacteriaceae bacterium]
MYRTIIRPILFLFDPEKVHYFTFSCLKGAFKIPFVASIIRSVYSIHNKRLERQLFGLTFKNPVGLAAGFDKNALLIDELPNFGFGFIEIGTVTPLPQKGNPKKRLFRLKEDQGIINRMGFNNDGLERICRRIKKRKGSILIGGNIGKNKATPNEKAVDDYLISFNDLFDYVDYFVVNVSSPNTPNLRELQDKKPLTKILNALQAENKKMAKFCPKGKAKPILLKIAPDLTDAQLLDIIDIVKNTEIDGVIATNTTISREGLVSSNKDETGGLSGKPLSSRSTEVIQFLAEKSNKSFPIIGVGGIHSAEDAIEKIKAGADLVQIYTGFIYKGPILVKQINKALLA